MNRIKRIYRNALYSFKGLYGFLEPKTYILVKIINPVFQVLCFSMIARHSYGNVDISPYVVGNAFLLCTINAFFGVGSVLIQERQLGTLKLIVASPSSRFTAFTSKSVFYILDGIITVIIGLVTGVVCFGVRIDAQCIPAFIICLAAAVFSTCAMGLLIGSIGLITRDINLLLNVSSMILMCLSGVDFPIEKLPAMLKLFSGIFPLTNVLKASKILMAGNINVMPYILREISIGVIYAIVAFILFKVMEKLSIKKALIDLY